METLAGNVGYLDLRELPDLDFDDPADPARRALDAALALLAERDAVIVDLRHNGGGSPASVGYLTSAFTPRGAPIYNRFRARLDGQTRSFDEAPLQWYPQPRLDVPLYVLTSARTGSAAEALAYTLQAARRATVIGEASAGAANPGGEFPLADGYRVFVSTGSPTNPITGGNWEGRGVQPDIATAAAQALDTARLRALERIVAAPGRSCRAGRALDPGSAARAGRAGRVRRRRLPGRVRTPAHRGRQRAFAAARWPPSAAAADRAAARPVLPQRRSGGAPAFRTRRRRPGRGAGNAAQRRTQQPLSALSAEPARAPPTRAAAAPIARSRAREPDDARPSKRAFTAAPARRSARMHGGAAPAGTAGSHPNLVPRRPRRLRPLSC
nr:S41 family peptidase [Lysobacter enzymogenes]